jgi:hypothetical protein
MSSTYWEGRIATVKALIEAYDAALLALASGAQQYVLSTGQSSQTVTKANLATLASTREGLLNELATLEARVYGCGAARIIPGF